MCALWPDVAVEDCNLTQSVFLLRKALQEGPREHRYVVTVPGKGYRFVAADRRQPGLPATGVRPISTSRIKGGDSLGSIVVLPFRGVNLQPDDEYLGLGIADNLTAMLGRVKQFVVRPSSALFQYAEAELEPL